jgi:hypothetical protein
VEHVRDQQWLAEASAPDRPAPTSTMHPAPLLTLPPPPDARAGEAPRPPAASADAPPSSGWPRGAPPDGMFSPAPSRPFRVPLATDQTRDARPFPDSRGQRPMSNPSGARKAALWAGLLVLVVVAAVAAAVVFRR